MIAMKQTSVFRKLTTHSLACAVIGLGMGLTQVCLADTVAIPLGQQGKAWNVESPRHGLTKEQVAEKFGQPSNKSGPVGTPPIYKWEYSTFSVYFESNRVIHSVIKHQPK